jgi:hypothetical protein
LVKSVANSSKNNDDDSTLTFTFVAIFSVINESIQ